MRRPCIAENGAAVANRDNQTALNTTIVPVVRAQSANENRSATAASHALNNASQDKSCSFTRPVDAGIGRPC